MVHVKLGSIRVIWSCAPIVINRPWEDNSSVHMHMQGVNSLIYGNNWDMNLCSIVLKFRTVASSFVTVSNILFHTVYEI